MDARTHFVGTWEVSISPWSRLQGRAGKVEDTEACDVRDGEVRSGHSSDEGSEQGSDPAELLERRPRPKGKLGDPTTHHTRRWACVSHGIKQLRQIDCRHARRCDPREEPVALTRTTGSVRGARGNPGPYRDDDDKMPVAVNLSASPQAVEEGNSVTVTVTMTGSRNTDVTIPLAYTPGVPDPAEDGDYVKVESILIPGGALTASGELQTIDDEFAENEEVFAVAIAADQLPDRVEVGSDASAEIRILDNDTPPPVEVRLSVDLVNVKEGERVTVTVSLPKDKDIASDLTIPLVLTDVSTDAWDYAAPVPIAVQIKAEEESGSYTIATTPDAVDEGDEAFTVTFGELPSRVVAGDPTSVQVMILDDDQAGMDVPITVSVLEGASETFELSLTSEPEGEVTVEMNWPAGTDLTVTPVRRIFTPDNWEVKQQVTLRAANDPDRVPDPVVTVALTAAGGGYTGITETVEVTIIENDLPGINAPAAVTMTEGGSATFEVALVVAASGEVTLSIPRAVGDLTASPTRLTFTPGNWSTPQQITLTAAEDDDFFTDTETLTLSAGGGEYAGVMHEVEVTIIDNDAAGIVAADEIMIPEGSTDVFTVNLLAQPSGNVTVDLAGYAGTDLSLDQTSLTFTRTDWNVPQTVTLTAAEDDADYTNDEIPLAITASGGGYNETHTTLVTIIDNDEAPLMVSILNQSGLENEEHLQLRIQLNRPAEEVVTVQYATSNQTAVAGDDYTASRGIVIFDPGATRGVVEIEVINDEVPEPDETFHVTLSNPSANVQIDREVGIGTILDNDGNAKLRVDDALVLEEDGRVRFRVSLSHPQPEMVSAEYQTRDGTAKAGEDYEATSGMVTLAPGIIEAVIAVPILKDGLDWQEETFSLHLVSSENAEIEKAVGVATIQESTAVSEGILEAYTARFVRTASIQIVEALGDRFRLAADGAVCGAMQRSETAQLWHSASSWDPSLGELLAGCRMSQSLPLSSGSFSVWGQGAFRQFNGKGENALTLQGDVTTGMLGADYRWKGGWLAGVLLAHSQGDGAFEVAAQSGEITAGLTGVYPYVSYTRSGWDLWLTGGAGRGQAEVRELKGDLVSRFGALGMRGMLAKGRWIGLSYQGDILVIGAEIAEHNIAAEVYRIRAGLEASAQIVGSIRPYVEMNVRQDGGSAETGTGLELGGGLRAHYPAWHLQAEVRTQGLIMHTADGFTEWGLSGALQMGSSREGPMMRLRPSWGRDQRMSMYRQQTILDAAPMEANAHRTELELGYGIPWKEGTARSVIGVTQARQGRMYRLGGELRPWERLSFSIFGLGQVRETALENIGVNVRGALRY